MSCILHGGEEEEISSSIIHLAWVRGGGGEYFCRELMQIFAAASAAAGVDCFSEWKVVVVWIF